MVFYPLQTRHARVHLTAILVILHLEQPVFAFNARIATIYTLAHAYQPARVDTMETEQEISIENVLSF